MTKVQDFLNKAPEFLAAFDAIFTQGFFETIECSGNSYENSRSSGEFGNISFKAVGYIPEDPKDQKKGMMPFFSPHQLLENIRLFLAEDGCKFTHAPTIEVNSENWPLWDRGGNNILGSRGRKFTLRIFVQHDRKTKK
jgi:hypothetical protein